MVLPFVPPNHGYNLRSSNNFNFVIPQAKTVSYFNSFLPSTIQLWNNLPLEIKCIESFSSFKNVLKKPTVDKIKDVKIFNYGSRKENILHCQLRNESSNLNAHLYHQYLSEIASCTKCGYPNENNYHFFLECPAYNNQRRILFESLQNVIELESMSPGQILNTLLFGDRQLPYKINCSIFEAVQLYIKSSKRFCSIS